MELLQEEDRSLDEDTGDMKQAMSVLGVLDIVSYACFRGSQNDRNPAKEQQTYLT